VVAQAMNRHPLFAVLAAVAALAYLVAMTIAGALPQQKQLVKFEARGVMKPVPESITEARIEVGSRAAVLLRQGEGWTIAGGKPVTAELAKRVSLAVQFMNTAGPLRILDAPELTGSNPREFGLQPPQLRATLYRGNETILGAAFGAHNPDDTAQYMSLDGRPELYLMSRFVGQEWEAVAAGIGLAPVSAGPSGR
jgi:hypothetical protein